MNTISDQFKLNRTRLLSGKINYEIIEKKYSYEIYGFYFDDTNTLEIIKV